MKTKYPLHKSLLLALVVCYVNLFAQVPQGVNYQSIIRNTAGAVMSNSAVTVDFKLYDGLTGPLLYHETHSTTTNQFGMVNLIIGHGTQLGGSVSSFSAIPWVVGVGYEVYVNSNLIGSRQLFMSVPYALHSRAPIVTYSNNILSVGENTTTINTTAPVTPTIIGTGVAVVSPTVGNNFSVDVPAPVLSYNNATKELSITQGTAVTTQTLIGTGSNTISMASTGIANVSPTVGNNFTVNVQPPSFTNNGPSTIVGTYPNYTLNSVASPSTTLVQGNNVALNQSGNTYTVSSVTPTLNVVGASLTGSYPNQTITVPSPTPVTITGSTNISVSGTTPNFTLSSPSQSLNLSTNVLSITGGNSVTLPATVINGTGTGISTVTTSATNFTVNVPKPTYTSSSGILSFGGTNTVSITSPLSLSGSTLTSGVSSNTVDLSTVPGLWSATTNTAGTSLYPSNLGNKVGIGTNTPNNLFQVQNLINFENNGSNISLGPNAGNNTSPSAYYNTFVGYSAGQAVTTNTGTASGNTYIGYHSGYANVGSSNTFVGSNSGSAVTIGNNNVAVGNGAGANQTTASSNVFIGSGADLSTSTQYTNATAIGYNAKVNADNSMILGNTTTSVGIGVNAPTEKLEVNGSVVIDGAASDYKYGTAKTRYLSIPPIAFASEDPMLYQIKHGSNGHVYTVATNTLTTCYATYYKAPVNLPDGAVVTKLDFYLVDNSSCDFSVTQLWKVSAIVGSAYGSANIIANAGGTSGVNANIQLITTSTIATPVIDNQTNLYYIRIGGVYGGAGNETNLRLARVLITYTVDKAD